jgi:hypothetical protein
MPADSRALSPCWGKAARRNRSSRSSSAPRNTIRHAGAAVLDALYRDVLGRPVDATGLADWGPALDHFSPQTVAALVLASPEAQARLVAGFFQSYLGRAGSGSEIQLFVSFLQQGVHTEFNLTRSSYSAVVQWPIGQFQLVVLLVGSGEYAANALL